MGVGYFVPRRSICKFEGSILAKELNHMLARRG